MGSHAPVAHRSRLPPIHLSSTFDTSTEASAAATAPAATAALLLDDLRTVAAPVTPLLSAPAAALATDA
jgi:hypothetical protein